MMSTSIIQAAVVTETLRFAKYVVADICCQFLAVETSRELCCSFTVVAALRQSTKSCAATLNMLASAAAAVLVVLVVVLVVGVKVSGIGWGGWRCRLLRLRNGSNPCENGDKTCSCSR